MSSSLEDDLKQLDALHTSEDVHGALTLAKQLHSLHAEHAGVLWRLARAHYIVAREHVGESGKAAREAEIRTGLQLAQQALALDDADFAVHKWNGILLGALSEFVSTKEKIGDAFKIKAFFERGIALNPADATLHHCLGSWCYSVSNIGFMERSIASVIFATPPTATSEEAEAHLLKCYELDPKQSFNAILLGNVYYGRRNWAEAKRWYKIASECPANTAAAKADVEQAKEKMAKC
jgi:tetratricopeptide (TPR) repeat protein